MPDWAAPWLTASTVEVLGAIDGAPHVLAGTTPRGQRVVVKRDPGGRGAHAVRVMRAVRRAVPAGSVLRVPAVVRWQARQGVVVQEAATGPTLREGLDGRARKMLLGQAAQALAALHGCGARVAPVTSMRDHLAELIHPHPREFARAVPALASRVRALIRALAAYQPPPGTPVVPIHRDAHARQLIVGRGHLTLVDWDLAAAGDAALDVANFAIYLRTHLATGADAAAATFLAAYARAGGDVSPRLGAASALTCLRLAVKAWRLGRPGWHDRAARLLADAGRALS